MANCPSCGAPVEGDFNTCPFCGSTIPSKKEEDIRNDNEEDNEVDDDVEDYSVTQPINKKLGLSTSAKLSLFIFILILVLLDYLCHLLPL